MNGLYNADKSIRHDVCWQLTCSTSDILFIVWKSKIISRLSFPYIRYRSFISTGLCISRNSGTVFTQD